VREEIAMKVLLVNGSPNKNGCTYTALTEAAKTLKAAGTCAGAAIDPCMAELVIPGLFLRVLQHIIGLIDLFHLFFGGLGIILIHIRMIFLGHLSIGFLDFSLRGAFLYAQHLIIIAFLAHVAPSS
jgi:hypothetical protein